MTCKLLTRLLLIFVAGLSVVSCNDNPFKPIDESESNDSFIVTMPRGILETRAINQENLTVEVTVNGVALTPTQDDGTTTVAATIDQGEQLLIEVNWFEQFENRPLQLASLSEVFPVVRDGERIQLDADNYDTSQFDDDNDTESNLLERRNGTDPFDSTSSTARGVEATTAPPKPTQFLAMIIGTTTANWDAFYPTATATILVAYNASSAVPVSLKETMRKTMRNSDQGLRELSRPISPPGPCQSMALSVK